MIVVAVIDLALATFASSALGAATPQAAARCDKFAAPSGSDLHAGSLKHPYRTPRRLLWSLKNGQTGCLRGGTYGTADSYHRLLSGGAPKHRKTLTAYPGERATIDGYVELLGSYVTLRNLVFDGSNSRLVNPYKCGTQALGLLLQGHDEIFEHNEVFQSGNKGSAIIQHGDRNIIRYNKLHDFGSCYAYDHGVYVGDGDSVQIYGNWIWNNPHGWGVQVYPGPTNARIHDNVIDSNGGGFVISDDGTATSTGNQIYENVVMNSVGLTTQSGFFIDGAGLSGSGPVPGSSNTFVGNALFNTAVGESPNVTVADNVSVDPLFVDAAAHNYALSPSSPLLAWGLWNGR